MIGRMSTTWPFVLLLVACDQGGAPGDAVVETAADTAGDPADEPSPDAVPDAAPDIPDAGDPEAAAPCAPSWHPTACSDCTGTGDASGCVQSCDATACADGHAYRAECDTATMTCTCLIDGVEACTCTPVNSPGGAMGCQPEEWGGANCCWNVG
jgi:hypothetical protein